MTGWTARPSRFFSFRNQLDPVRPERPAGRHSSRSGAMNFAGEDVPADAEALAAREHMPYVTGAGSFAPCFFGAMWLGRRASDAAVGLKVRDWCDELIARHRLPAGALDDYATLLS